jgi:hypothetical protein
MSYEDRDDVVFQEAFKNKPEGHALYTYVKSSKLRPGSCGYFDVNGVWRSIAQLADDNMGTPPPEFTTLTPPAARLALDPDPRSETWHLMASEGVKEFNPTLQAGVKLVPSYFYGC